MTQTEVETFLASLPDVQRTEAFGYRFFFVGDDHRMPFVTLADHDTEYDSVSALDRDGVYRINIGVGRDSFESLFRDLGPEPHDYTTLDRFLPHPDYAKQRFICILSPSAKNADSVRRLIIEAHGIAADRYARRAGRREGAE